MKRHVFIKTTTIFLLILFLVVPTLSYAATVVGSLFGVGPYGNYPAQRIPVTLISNRTGRSSPSYTDYQGNYYIYNVPPGPYTLEVWVNAYSPMVFQITVFNNQPVTTLPPYRVF